MLEISLFLWTTSSCAPTPPLAPPPKASLSSCSGAESEGSGQILLKCHPCLAGKVLGKGSSLWLLSFPWTVNGTLILQAKQNWEDQNSALSLPSQHTACILTIRAGWRKGILNFSDTLISLSAFFLEKWMGLLLRSDCSKLLHIAKTF